MGAKARRVCRHAHVLEEEHAVQEKNIIRKWAEGGRQRHVERSIHCRGESGVEVKLRINAQCWAGTTVRLTAGRRK